VLSIAGGFPISRIFLYRIEPNMFGKGGAEATPTLQIEMPLEGVINSKLFLDAFIEHLIETKQITREHFEKLQSAYKKPTYTSYTPTQPEPPDV
jgi:hypothetical protein